MELSFQNEIKEKVKQLQLNLNIVVGTKKEILLNHRNKIDGIELLKQCKNEYSKVIFFDPQYRGILDKQHYGNEGISRGQRRCALTQMSEEKIQEFINEIDRVLTKSGYLFLWIDKFHLCEGIHKWIKNTQLQIVDLIVWDKNKIGMGYRTRNRCEFLMVLQKTPIKVKGTWNLHNIPNVWVEKVKTANHPHTKPIELQMKLIEATTHKDDIVIDPAMGSGSVFTACKMIGRNFLGGDING